MTDRFLEVPVEQGRITSDEFRFRKVFHEPTGTQFAGYGIRRCQRLRKKPGREKDLTTADLDLGS